MRLSEKANSGQWNVTAFYKCSLPGFREDFSNFTRKVVKVVDGRKKILDRHHLLLFGMLVFPLFALGLYFYFRKNKRESVSIDPVIEKKFLLVESYVRDHFSEKLSIDIVCKQLKLTNSEFFAIFRYKGIKFTVLLNQIRCNRAKELLSGSSLNVSEIAFAVGYTDAQYFARVFKQITGNTPSDYRK